MSLQRTPELLSYLSTFFDRDMEADAQAARDFAATAPAAKAERIVSQAKALLAGPEFPVDELGNEANRWFGDDDEARSWLRRVIEPLEKASGGASADAVVKDSNGTPLAEGDSVTVIKDLKVKGGSSDLKRGTLIKKIHLIGDPDNIECRVDGSTLVLKTMFLKKA